MATKRRTTPKAKRKPSPQANPGRHIVLTKGQELIVSYGPPKPGRKPTIKRLRRGLSIRIIAADGPSGSSDSPDGKQR